MNKQSITAVIVLTLLACPMITWAAATRIDFGPEGSPVREGFVRVSGTDRYSTGQPAGWSEDSEITDVDYDVPRKPFPPVIYTTDIRRDSAQGTSPAELTVSAMPNTTYRVWMLCGTGGGDWGWGQVWDMQLQVGGESEPVSTTFFGPNTARILLLEGRSDSAGELRIEISTRSRWSINAMVIAPEAEWSDLAAEIKALEREVKLLPDDVLANWEHKPHVDNTVPPTYTQEERDKGYVVHQRSWVTPIWPNTVPRRSETGVKLEMFASPGEYEPATFSILPFRSFDDIQVEVSDLRSDAGDHISAEHIDRRYVQYRFVRPDYKTFGTYYRSPDLLQPLADDQQLTGDENFRIWLTVFVPKDANPGIYTGEVTLRIGGQDSETIPMRLRVLPIDLQKDRSVTYSTYYRHPRRYLKTAPDDFSREWWTRKIESDMKAMASHGYNGFRPSISASVQDDGAIRVNLEGMKYEFDLAKQHGMDVDRPTMGDLAPSVRSLYAKHIGKRFGSHLYDVKMPSDQFFDDVTRMIAAVEQTRIELELPELVYALVDEPSDRQNSLAFTRRLYEAAKRVPNIRTYLTADPSREAFGVFEPYVDVWCMPYLDRRGLDRGEWAKRGNEIWSYPNYVAGQNDHSAVTGARMVYGFLRWRHQVPTLIPWIFESWGGDPYNHLDALQMDFFNSTDDNGELVPCTLFEAYREGIDDNRYITTLEQRIAEAEALGLDAVVAEAKADLQYVHTAVPVIEPDPYDVGWADEAFDIHRWIIARRIMLLQDAIDGHATDVARVGTR